MAYLVLHTLNLCRVERTRREPKVGQFDVPSAVDQEVLRLQISVCSTLKSVQMSERAGKVSLDEVQSGLTDVSELVELVDRHEHLGDVEPSVLFLEHTRVVEKSSEVASGDILLQSAKAKAVDQRPSQASGEERDPGFGSQF